VCVYILIQEIIKDFERSCSDMVGSFLETVQSQYPLSSSSETYTIIIFTDLVTLEVLDDLTAN
jgi:hypothetical protein